MGAASKVVKAEIALKVVKLTAALIGLAAAAKGLHIAVGKRKQRKNH